MELKASRRGAAVVALWVTIFGAVICLLFALLGAAPGFILCIFLTFCVLAIVVAARVSTCFFRCGAHHVTLRRGLLFLTTQRIPLRFISGCSVWRTPLERLSGTCVFTLYTSGSFAAVFGLRYSEALMLAQKLGGLQEGGNQ